MEKKENDYHSEHTSLVFVAYSMESRMKRICKSVYSVYSIKSIVYVFIYVSQKIILIEVWTIQVYFKKLP